jgi:PhzF family phenazine biosynthesis protein
VTSSRSRRASSRSRSTASGRSRFLHQPAQRLRVRPAHPGELGRERRRERFETADRGGERVDAGTDGFHAFVDAADAAIERRPNVSAHAANHAPHPTPGRRVRVMPRAFAQVDVFTSTPYAGNPVAVVLDADDLDSAAMQRFAHWTNLSETTFVLPPTDAGADYRVRIFTPTTELPFAGHPTLGTCHAWLERGGVARRDDVIVQQCDAGLVPIRRTPNGLAFAAPPLLRGGPVEESLIEHVAKVLRIDRASILDASWADNGPGWVAVLLADAEAVLALRPGFVDLDVGAVGPYPDGSPCAFELRAFFPKDGSTVEDPVTGSLNASVAEWLLDSGRATAPYVASQGTALGRAGRVHVTRDADGTIWVGGGTVTCIAGTVLLQDQEREPGVAT